MFNHPSNNLNRYVKTISEDLLETRFIEAFHIDLAKLDVADLLGVIAKKENIIQNATNLPSELIQEVISY